MRLPEKELRQRDVEGLWIADRKSLIQCSSRHKALVDYIKDRDEALGG